MGRPRKYFTNEERRQGKREKEARKRARRRARAQEPNGTHQEDSSPLAPNGTSTNTASPSHYQLRSVAPSEQEIVYKCSCAAWLAGRAEAHEHLSISSDHRCFPRLGGEEPAIASLVGANFEAQKTAPTSRPEHDTAMTTAQESSPSSRSLPARISQTSPPSNGSSNQNNTGPRKDTVNNQKTSEAAVENEKSEHSTKDRSGLLSAGEKTCACAVCSAQLRSNNQDPHDKDHDVAIESQDGLPSNVGTADKNDSETQNSSVTRNVTILKVGTPRGTDHVSANKPSTGGSRSAKAQIIQTNDHCTVSKRSVEDLYYPKPHFYRYFVNERKARAPLVNRGYWLRMQVIERRLKRFLDQTTSAQKVVINLGCG